nr:translation initiation factor IF-2-like [Gorilla gorilla gorilla]
MTMHWCLSWRPSGSPNRPEPPAPAEAAPCTWLGSIWPTQTWPGRPKAAGGTLRSEPPPGPERAAPGKQCGANLKSQILESATSHAVKGNPGASKPNLGRRWRSKACKFPVRHCAGGSRAARGRVPTLRPAVPGDREGVAGSEGAWREEGRGGEGREGEGRGAGGAGALRGRTHPRRYPQAALASAGGGRGRGSLGAHRRPCGWVRAPGRPSSTPGPRPSLPGPRQAPRPRPSPSAGSGSSSTGAQGWGTGAPPADREHRPRRPAPVHSVEAMGSPRPSEAATPVPAGRVVRPFPTESSQHLEKQRRAPRTAWPGEKIPKLQLSPTPLPSSFHPPFPPLKLGGPIPPPVRGVSRTLRGPGARRCPPGAHGAGAGAGRPGGEGTPDLRRPGRRRFPLFIQVCAKRSLTDAVLGLVDSNRLVLM